MCELKVDQKEPSKALKILTSVKRGLEKADAESSKEICKKVTHLLDGEEPVRWTEKYNFGDTEIGEIYSPDTGEEHTTMNYF